jgi:hypothetical protein
VPWAFDALVGPLFALAATDLTRPVAATTGNVLRSLEAGNRLRGSAGPVMSGLARNLVTRLDGLGPKSASSAGTGLANEHAAAPAST